MRAVRLDPTAVTIDGRVAGRDYQRECIDVLTRAIVQGRRKLLVEMATGTGKTRTAAGLIKRLFDASAITRVLSLVDRATLAKQTEDAFVEHIRDIPVQRVAGGGRPMPVSNGIVVCTLQTMINDYARYSAGYFDLVITDECHRSIYGEFRRLLEHFDAVKIGLTATPLVDKEDLDEEDRIAVRDTLRFFEVTEPTYRYTLKEAIDAGYLVPYRIYQARTVRTAAADGFEVRRSEID